MIMKHEVEGDFLYDFFASYVDCDIIECIPFFTLHNMFYRYDMYYSEVRSFCWWLKENGYYDKFKVNKRIYQTWNGKIKVYYALEKHPGKYNGKTLRSIMKDLLIKYQTDLNIGRFDPIDYEYNYIGYRYGKDGEQDTEQPDVSENR